MENLASCPEKCKLLKSPTKTCDHVYQYFFSLYWKTSTAHCYEIRQAKGNHVQVFVRAHMIAFWADMVNKSTVIQIEAPHQWCFSSHHDTEEEETLAAVIVP